MKYLRILFGLTILYATGKEYVHASKQLGSFFSPGILIGILLVLLLTTWLIGGALAGNGLKLKSFDFLKYFAASLFIFVMISLFNLSKAVVPKDYTEINGLNIPLSPCMDGNKRIIPDEADRRDFCMCVFEKTTADAEVKNTYQEDLTMGRIDKVFQELQESGKFIELGIEDCTTSMGETWTPVMVDKFKENCMNEDFGVDFKENNDQNTYCECMITSYMEYPMDSVMQDGFMESELAVSIEEKCTQESLKVKDE